MQGLYIKPIHLQTINPITKTATIIETILPFLLKFFQICIYPPSI